MNWRVFTAMAALFGAVALGSCDSGKSEKDLCPGEDRILSSSGGCCDDNDYSGFCDYKEPAGQEDVSESGLDTLVGDTTSPEKCLICDDFSDLEYTEANWDTIKSSETKLYISDGVLTSEDALFVSKSFFNPNQDYIFEIRYKLESLGTEFLGSFYIPYGDWIKGYTINKDGSNEIAFEGSTSGYLDPAEWHTLRIVSTEQEGEQISVDGQAPFYSVPVKPTMPPEGLGVIFGTNQLFEETNLVKIDYIEIKKL